MHPVVILLIAVMIVLVSILVFRLHAFLALTFAALVVALLTPRVAIESFMLGGGARRVVAGSISETAATVRLTSRGSPVEVGDRLLVVAREASAGRTSARLRIVGNVIVQAVSGEGVIAAVLNSSTAGSWPEDALVVSREAFRAAQKNARSTVGERVAAAFGSTCGKIGILIALPSGIIK